MVTFALGTATGIGSGGNGKQREATALVTFGLGQAWDATGRNGFGNFRTGNHYWDRLGRQREAMALVTFGLGTITRTGSGGNGRRWLW